MKFFSIINCQSWERCETKFLSNTIGNDNELFYVLMFNRINLVKRIGGRNVPTSQTRSLGSSPNIGHSNVYYKRVLLVVI